MWVTLLKVYVSFLQIYNESIYDLLNASMFKKQGCIFNEGLKLKWNAYDQFCVENLFMVECLSIEDVSYTRDLTALARSSAISITASRTKSLVRTRWIWLQVDRTQFERSR